MPRPRVVFSSAGTLNPALLQQLLQDMVADSQRAGEGHCAAFVRWCRKDKSVVRSVA